MVARRIVVTVALWAAVSSMVVADDDSLLLDEMPPVSTVFASELPLNQSDATMEAATIPQCPVERGIEAKGTVLRKLAVQDESKCCIECKKDSQCQEWMFLSGGQPDNCVFLKDLKSLKKNPNAVVGLRAQKVPNNNRILRFDIEYKDKTFLRVRKTQDECSKYCASVLLCKASVFHRPTGMCDLKLGFCCTVWSRGAVSCIM